MKKKRSIYIAKLVDYKNRIKKLLEKPIVVVLVIVKQILFQKKKKLDQAKNV
jgi:hypothetical protein